MIASRWRPPECALQSWLTTTPAAGAAKTFAEGRVIGYELILITRQGRRVNVSFAVNSPDAMPKGGTLTIDTENVDVDATYTGARPGLKPGRYLTKGEGERDVT